MKRRGQRLNAAAAATSPSSPCRGAIVQMIGVFSDTIIIQYCASAMIILLAGESRVPLVNRRHSASPTCNALWLDCQWVPVLSRAYRHSVRTSSIVANYIYAENNLFFCGHYSTQRPSAITLATLSGMVIAGTLISFPLIWQLLMIMACIRITNLTAILLLTGGVYRRRLSATTETGRKTAKFRSAALPGYRTTTGAVYRCGIARLSRQSQLSGQSLFGKLFAWYSPGTGYADSDFTCKKRVDYQSPLTTTRYTQPELLDHSQQLCSTGPPAFGAANFVPDAAGNSATTGGSQRHAFS